MKLTPRQRKVLRGLAHDLEPVVRVGKERLTPSVAEETDRSLEAHELIKVRLDLEGGDQRRTLAEELADRTRSTVVGLIGKVATLYRRRDDDPKIRL